MRRVTRATATTLLLALVASIGVIPMTSASATFLGPTLSKVRYEWMPRTGVVKVTAKVRCRKVERNAHWGFELTQGKTTAQDRNTVRCDGELRRSTLVLDPRKGRFHPGRAVAWQSAGACESDFCWEVELLLNDFRIPPPGRGDRGAR
jgi:hypothetical protein